MVFETLSLTLTWFIGCRLVEVPQVIHPNDNIIMAPVNANATPRLR